MTLIVPRESKGLSKQFLSFLFVVIVMNVIVAMLSDTAAQVSWDRLDAPEVTGYIVY